LSCKHVITNEGTASAPDWQNRRIPPSAALSSRRMRVESDTGRLLGARQVPSPNLDDRPPDTPIDLIVVHGISLPPGQFGKSHVEALFTNRLDPEVHPYFRQLRDLRVSAHLYISRDGAVTQFVPFMDRAWHAGVSSFEGRPHCNDRSIGIELEGTDTLPYTDDQYRALTEVIHALRAAYPAIGERIVGHVDIAPERKTDPGPAFDWHRLRRQLLDTAPARHPVQT
jgi:AmpD protein